MITRVAPEVEPATGNAWPRTGGGDVEVVVDLMADGGGRTAVGRTVTVGRFCAVATEEVDVAEDADVDAPPPVPSVGPAGPSAEALVVELHDGAA